MEEGAPSSTGRKVKFSPKAPPRRKPPQPIFAKTEDINDDEKASQAQDLLRRFNENIARRGSKVDKKSSAQVSFGPGPDSSTTPLRSYGVAREGNSGKRSVPEPKTFNNLDISTVISADDLSEDGTLACSNHTVTGLTKVPKKEDEDPWDYQSSYYPTRLPFRRPCSGNQELIDEAEFGPDATKAEYDESTINPAFELGLLEEGGEKKMFFFQFPSSLPEMIQLASSNGKEKVGDSAHSITNSEKCIGLEDLPSGLMGKMLVYKSGAIKLKLGDNLCDVAPGSDCSFAQDVAAINVVDRQCCVLGELRKRAVVTPDVESLLKGVIDLG